MITREMRLYLTVPGASIYFILLLLIYFPVWDAYDHVLKAETLVFNGFLTVIFYPISLVLVALGNPHLNRFRWMALSFLPFILAGGLIGIFWYK